MLKGHTNWVTAAIFMPDGKHVVTAAWDNTVRIWDAQTSEEMARFYAHDARLTSIAASPDGERPVTGS